MVRSIPWWRNTFAVCLAAPLAAFGATSVFQQPVRLDLPAPASYTATADFDADGDSDLLLLTDAAVSVYRPNGDMTFSAPVQTAGAIDSKKGAGLGHLNADAFPDVAYIDSTDRVVVLLGTGSGGFTTSATLFLGSTTRDVLIGDFTGDGKADVLANSGDNLFVFPGDGAGAVGSPIVSPTIGSIFGAAAVRNDTAAGDFDDDGDLDLGVASAAGNLVRNEGGGTFAWPVQVGAGGARAVAAGDFNNDGRDDLIFLRVSRGSGYLRVYKQNASGALVLDTETVSVESGDRMAVSDLNGDGRLDIVAASADQPVVTVHLGNGNARFVATHYLTATRGSSLSVADYSGDGHPDVLQYDALILGNGDGTLRASRAVPEASKEVAFGHIDGDGKLDLLTFTQRNDQNLICVRRGNGDGTFGNATFVNTNANIASVGFGDIDGDGFLDAWMSGDGFNASGSVFLSDGAGGFAAKVTSLSSLANGPNAGRGEFIDLTGDGKDDLVFFSDEHLQVRESKGDGTFSGVASVTAPFGVPPVAGDIDNDGNLDFVGRDAIAMGNGGGTFTIVVPSEPSSAIALADLDDDGNLDLVAREEAGNVEVRLGNGDGTFGAPRELFFKGEGENWSSDFFGPVKTGDVDGDGNVDLISRGTGVLLGDGNGWFKDFQAYHDAPVRDFAMADLDANGTPDIGLLCSAVHAGTSPIGIMLTSLTDSFEEPLTVDLSTGPDPSESGQLVTMTANLTAPGFVPLGAVLFSAGGELAGIDGFSGRTAAIANVALPSGTHTVTATYSRDHHFAPASDSTEQEVVGSPFEDGFPVVATATGTLSALVDWVGVDGTKAYDVYRGTTLSNFALIGTMSAPGPFSDVTASAGTTYLYRVVARNGANSVTSEFDLATTIIHPNDPLVPHSTRVRLVHITTLRDAVNAVRTAAGLGPFTFSDPPVLHGPILASHLTEMRSALSEAFTVLGRSISFTDPVITPLVTPVRAVHWQELRDGTR